MASVKSREKTKGSPGPGPVAVIGAGLACIGALGTAVMLLNKSRTNKTNLTPSDLTAYADKLDPLRENDQGEEK